MRGKQKILQVGGPSNINLGIFFVTLMFAGLLFIGLFKLVQLGPVSQGWKVFLQPRGRFGKSAISHDRSGERRAHRCHTNKLNRDLVCGCVNLEMLPLLTFWRADLMDFSKTLYENRNSNLYIANCHTIYQECSV